MNRRRFLVTAAAAPLALRSARALAALAPVAVVTADTEARVVAVDAVRGVVLRSVDVLPGPRSVETVGGRLAVVAHTAYGALTILEGRDLAKRHVVEGLEEPRYTAAHPDGRHAFVTDSGSSEVLAVDVFRGRVLGRVAVGGWARHVSLDPTGRVLWLGLGTASERLAVVDVSTPARPRLVRHVRPPFRAHDVAFAPDGTVWVTSGDRGRVAIFAGAAAREPALQLAADGAPQHVTFARGVAYVTSGADGTLRVHTLRDGRLLRTTAIPPGSYNVQHGYGRVLTPSLSRGTLCILGSGGGVVREVRVAASSHDACFVS